MLSNRGASTVHALASAVEFTRRRHANFAAYHSAVDGGWSAAILALQPKLGVLPKRWFGYRPYCVAHAVVNGPILSHLGLGAGEP